MAVELDISPPYQNYISMNVLVTRYLVNLSAPIAKHDLAFAFVRWGQVLDLGFAFDFEAVLYIRLSFYHNCMPHKARRRNRLISQRLRLLYVIPSGPFLLHHITYTTTIYLSTTYNTAEVYTPVSRCNQL